MRSNLRIALLLVAAAACAAHPKPATGLAAAGTPYLDHACAAGEDLVATNPSAEWIRVYGIRSGDPAAAAGSEILGDVAPRTTRVILSNSRPDLRRVDTRSIDNPSNATASPRVPAGVELACRKRS